MEPPDTKELSRLLEESREKARYWKQIAKKNGALRLRESENLSAMIQTLQETKARLIEEIGEREQVEEALRESESRFRIAGKVAYDLIYEWEVKSDTLEWFGDFDGLIGYRRGEIGRDIESWAALVHPDDRRKMAEAVALHRTSLAPIRYEYRVRRKDGVYIYLADHALPLPGADGAPARWIGVCRDISARKKSEIARQESKERLRAILQASPDPMVMYDLKGHPQFLNPAFTTVFGWTLEEVKGARIPFIPADQEEPTRRHIDEIFQSGKTARFESRRLTRDGRVLDIFVTAAAVREPGGRPIGMVVYLSDISERKLMETQIEQVQRMESLGTLAGGIAHNFNNILMGIQGRTSLMRLGMEAEDPHRSHLDGIEKHVQSAARLTGKILSFAVEGNYRTEPIDLFSLAETTAEMFGRNRREVRVHTKSQPGHHMVEANRRQIEQVLLNIYVNACQAMPEGGSLYIGSSHLRLGEEDARPYRIAPGPYVHLSITDTGPGMDPWTVRRIFDPFFTTRKDGRGTGMGLASAYGIVKNLGGIITAYSEKGSGTTINVYLPETQKKSLPEPPAMGKLVRGSESILLVDDEETILNIARAMLRSLGYYVVTADSGEAAVATVRDSGKVYDLIILDMIMPEMDGGRAFDLIREVRPSQPVLLASGYALNRQTEAILARGCDGFIQKPFTIGELSDKIRSILDRDRDKSDDQRPTLP